MKELTFSPEELARIRADFPILSRPGRGGEPIAYFDTAATSHKPRQVIDVEADFYRTSNAAVHRGTHMLGDEATIIFEEAREAVAQFVGAAPEEIVWTKNATEAINLVTYAMSNASLGLGGPAAEWFAIKPGDRIVVTRAEHHSNLVPWQELAARTGAELAWIDLLPDGRFDLDTLSVITPNTRIVAFTHASNVTGAISPVSDVVLAAKKVGALTLLDTCQSSAHMPVDVHHLGVDFAVFSSHKMFGPTGLGALWGREELLQAMPPVMTGGSVVANVTMDKTEYLPAPNRFEAGSQAVAQAAGWKAAIDFLSGVGMDRIAAQEQKMLVPLLDGIDSVPGVKLLGPTDPKERLGVVSFEVEGVHPHDVGQVLDSFDVAVRVGHHCAIPLHEFFGAKSSSRASLSLTNTEEEIERLVGGLAQVQSYFGR